MAAGDLSADQRRYHAAFVAATGMDPTVVTAWIGIESGWGTTKTNHNYLNVMRDGQQRTYDSATSAAAFAAGLINRSDHYGTIRQAIAAGDPERQIAAIAASPWDAGNYGGDGHNIIRVYEALTDGSTGQRIRDLISDGAELFGDVRNKGVAGAVGERAVEAAGSIFQGWAGDAWRLLARGGLMLVLLVLAAALIMTGVLRMTRVDNRLIDVVAGTASRAPGVA